MKGWQRYLSYAGVTFWWLMSQAGLVSAQQFEAKPPKVSESGKDSLRNSPLYLVPSWAAPDLARIGGDADNFEQYRHYSHRSHSSHRSHNSHSSHYSAASSPGTGYSSSGAVGDLMDIRAAQRKLNDLGYDSGTADGIKGGQTVAAIKKFQEDYGLAVDGIIGSETKKRLESFSLSDIQRKLKDLGYECDALGTRDEKTVTAVQSFQSSFGLDGDGTVNLATKQKLDSMNLLEIQKKLRLLRYNVDPTGVRDVKTIKAIKDFQQASGLPANGTIDEKTLSALGM